MEGFEWAEDNFGVDSPHALQAKGPNVFFAPNIRPGIKVVNLANGQVDLFQEEEGRPQSGYYADYDDLARYCERNGISLSETNGQVSTQPFEQ